MTASKLKELFNYDKTTGIFTRKVKKGNRTKIDDVVGSVNSGGYLQVKIDGKLYQLHRLAWLYEYGKFPESKIDHDNHNKEDNRIDNLKAKSQLENCQNMSLSKKNTSGVCGVTYRKDTNKWVAQIRANKEYKFLGIFEDKEDAIKARKEAEIKYGFHANHGKREVA